MMLCALSSLCHAQKIKFEYDASGNVVKRYPPESVVNESLSDVYGIKLTFSKDGNSMNVKFYEKRTGNVVNCHIEVHIRGTVYTYINPVNVTSEKGDFDVDIRSLSKDVWAMEIAAFY